MSKPSLIDYAAGLPITEAAERRGKHRSASENALFLRTLANEDQSWKEQAACRGLGTAMFFSDAGSPGACRAARAVCAQCPVTVECAEFGARFSHGHGVWGGMVPEELRSWRRRRQRQLQAP